MIKKLIIYMIAVFLISRFLTGIIIKNWVSLLIFVIVLGVLNILIKPILSFLSLPLIWLTFGLFIFIINALLFYFASAIVEGVEVKSFGTALIASLLLSILIFILEYVLE